MAWLPRSTGSRRQFVSFGLKPGFSYKYEIHAEVVSNGKLVEDNRTVTLTAGQSTSRRVRCYWRKSGRSTWHPPIKADNACCRSYARWHSDRA